MSTVRGDENGATRICRVAPYGSAGISYEMPNAFATVLAVTSMMLGT